MRRSLEPALFVVRLVAVVDAAASAPAPAPVPAAAAAAMMLNQLQMYLIGGMNMAEVEKMIMRDATRIFAGIITILFILGGHLLEYIFLAPRLGNRFEIIKFPVAMRLIIVLSLFVAPYCLSDQLSTVEDVSCYITLRVLSALLYIYLCVYSARMAVQKYFIFRGINNNVNVIILFAGYYSMFFTALVMGLFYNSGFAKNYPNKK